MESKDMGVFEIKEEISKDDFLRETLVNLGINQETPFDIFNAEFEEIVTENRHFVGIGGSAEVKCSASVGHNYYVDETHYNEITKEFEKKRVKKTNWSPYQDTYFIESVWGFAENSENPNKIGFPVGVFSKKYLIPLDDLSPEELKEKGMKEAVPTVVDRAHKDMIYEAKHECKKKLPGDEYRHFTCETKERIKYYTNVLISQYSMKYKYDGQVYGAEQYVAGQRNPKIEVPQQKVEEKPDKKIKILGIASFVFSILLCVLSINVSFHVSTTVALIMFALSTAVFATFMWLEMKDRKKRTSGKWTSKRKGLVEILEKKGLAPLSDIEKTQFESIIKSAPKNAFGFLQGMPIGAYIASLFLMLFSYSSTFLAGLLVYIPLALVAFLVIKGLLILIKKK